MIKNDNNNHSFRNIKCNVFKEGQIRVKLDFLRVMFYHKELIQELIINSRYFSYCRLSIKIDKKSNKLSQQISDYLID